MFYARANIPYAVNVSNVGTECDPVLKLYDVNLKLKVTADYYSKGHGEGLDYIPAADGVCYLKIYNKASSCNAGNTASRFIKNSPYGSFNRSKTEGRLFFGFQSPVNKDFAFFCFSRIYPIKS